MKKALTIFTAFTLALLFSVAPALAIEDSQVPENNFCCEGDCSDSVYNRNCAMVNNMVMTRANTGENMADGSYAGSGGDGGSIRNKKGDVEDSSTGAGGDGGNAGYGGTVITGEAIAASEVKNLVNSNLAEINRCACAENDENCECSNDRIRNTNRAYLGNAVMTEASSGLNAALGSYAGAGGAGGAIANCGDEVENSTTGAGGAGGAGSDGGIIQTGASSAWSSVINVVNRNLTRILR